MLARAPDQAPPRLATYGLSKAFRITRGRSRHTLVRAVDDVSLRLAEGQTLGIVGESGCGKSTLGRLLAGLIAPTSGSIEVEGRCYDGVIWATKHLRGRVQMVFQDPSSALDPQMTIGASVAEPVLLGPRPAAKVATHEMLRLVGLPDDAYRRRPHELSGGEQQRACLARALVGGHRVIVLDEVVSALDPILRAQILALIQTLQSELKTSYLFISHDLRAVITVSSKVAVMYLGAVVELAPVANFRRGDLLHPYSVALHSAMLPLTRSKATTGIVLRGEMPNAADRPSGCPFHPRCPVAQSNCRTEKPTLVSIKPGVEVACHYPGALTA